MALDPKKIAEVIVGVGKPPAPAMPSTPKGPKKYGPGELEAAKELIAAVKLGQPERVLDAITTAIETCYPELAEGSPEEEQAETPAEEATEKEG